VGIQIPLVVFTTSSFGCKVVNGVDAISL